MPDDDGTLVDQDGVVHERGWDGQYRPRQGWLGPQRDTGWTGQPNVERDWLGRPQEARDWLGRPVRSRSGETLYRRAGDSGGSTGASGAGAVLTLIVMVAVLITGLIGIVLVATPIIAPVLLAITESAGKRNDLAAVKKWQPWATISSIVALLVVLGIAGLMALAPLYGVVALAQNSDLANVSARAFVLATAAGLVIFPLAFVTGISPTAVVYLRGKEAEAQASGRLATATRLRRLKRAIGITAAVIVAVVVMVFIAYMMVTAVVWWHVEGSQKLMGSALHSLISAIVLQ